jgi:tRNA (guanine9-N1)-methyltransferase
MEVMPKRKGGKLREDGTHDDDGDEEAEENGEEQDQQGKVEAAKEAVMDADSTTNVPETEVIEITKGLPTGETEAD